MPDNDLFDEAIEAFGGLEQMLKIGDDYDRRFGLLSGQLLDLIEEYPRQWVALAEGDVWVFADSHEQLLQEVRNRGLKTQYAVIMHLDPNPPVLILTEAARR